MNNLNSFLNENISFIQKEIIELKRKQTELQPKLQDKMISRTDSTELVAQMLELEKKIAYCDGALGVYLQLQAMVKEALEKSSKESYNYAGS